uniref:Uncharacterized protein n=1 Tax=Wolbachia endosymbiont of Aleurodicus dispersus TaxID=1288877 RepID=A0A3B0IWR2_9RICK
MFWVFSCFFEMFWKHFWFHLNVLKTFPKQSVLLRVMRLKAIYLIIIQKKKKNYKINNNLWCSNVSIISGKIYKNYGLYLPTFFS